MSESNFTKNLLQSYIITNCKRRLFFELAKNKPELWFNPLRDIKPPTRKVFERVSLLEKGKEYEQKVYSCLKVIDGTLYKEKVKNGKSEVIESKLDSLFLENHYKNLYLNSNETKILLEKQYFIPEAFFFNIFPPKSHQMILPIDYSQQRPDIMLLGNGINKYLDEIYELTYEGKIRKISEKTRDSRVGISIFDIKFTKEEKVGKKHFLEIYYYLITFAVFLHEHHLDSKYYVRANFNGIIPSKDDMVLNSVSSIDDLCKKLITRIQWKEAERIYRLVKNTITRLWQESPCPIEKISLNLHQGCGYCYYLEDCKYTLGMEEGSDPRTWSSKLLPFTSQSIAQQLIEEYHFNTIGDVLDQIDSIKVGSVPKPLYSELPMLKMKAEALISNNPVYPPKGQVSSYAIPRYSPIAINIDVEYDQNNDRIFGIGFYLKMFMHGRLPYYRVFDNWWRIWENSIKNNSTVEEIKKQLQDYLIRDIPIEVIIQFRKILKRLKKIVVSHKDEKNKYGTKVEFSYARINKNIKESDEAALLTRSIRYLNVLLTMCNIIEDYVVVDGYKEGTFFGPSTSLFYWSRNQLEHFQDMLERHLNYIIGNPKALDAYNSIMMYLNPTETEVSHPYQHKKLFDIQAFVSSSIGFPDIINYTWHGIARHFTNYKGNPKYWIPHFNFLDLNNWLLFLEESKPKEKEEIENEIRRQIIIKLKFINGIRELFQRKARHTLSDYSNVIGRTEYRSVILPNYYHDIAHVWYLFSKLSSTLQQQDDEYYRTIFPQFSIGKLFAARVLNLDIHRSSDNPRLYYYSFETHGLSSNMKVKEGDFVLLIPNSKRGMRLSEGFFNWRLSIESITWDPSISGNIIFTKLIRKNLFEQCDEEHINAYRESWYMYPLSSDPWSRKLYNQNHNALLDRNGFGRSWLGFRLAFLWDVRTEPHLLGPHKWDFQTPVVYLYAPRLLDTIKTNPIDSLLTSISPRLDGSQQFAIKNSLSRVISGILGPPGTGKSQTIAALIDEFIVRKQKNGKSFKILVSSFSYAALRVVVDKIRTSRDIKGNPTPSSLTQIVFIRSETRDIIQPKDGCRDVEDLVRRSNGSWRLNDQTHVVTSSKPLEESLEESFIIFANAHQLYYLNERTRGGFAFDLICVDEASQIPSDYFLSCLQYIHRYNVVIKPPEGRNIRPNSKIIEKKEVENIQLVSKLPFNELTKVVIVGDHNQLPPVRVKNPPKNLELILDSLFSYYINGHRISSSQLRINYRSHQDIVNFTSQLKLYEELTAYEENAIATLEGDLDKVNKKWVREVLSPERVVCSLIHFRKYEIGISEFEAKIVAELIIGYYNMISPRDQREELDFWTKNIGVVAPHNAQGSIIIRYVFDHFRELSHLSQSRLMESLKNTIYSVEKFQGSDRNLIIASIGLSDKDKISSEEEFIYDLNRFNVLTSRAKNKVIFVSSNEFLQYIPEDRNVLESASKIYMYVKEFCNELYNLTIKNENNRNEKVIFRYKN